jgi:eukaryotic-like serine/threonine-protein kinase
MSLAGKRLGRYSLQRLIGSGGMGEVYLAEDAQIDRQVAVKVIRGEESSSSDSTEFRDAARLFQREARAVARLNHPRILPLFDYGEEVTNEGVLIYMVMPFCEEGSLVNWLRQRGTNDVLSLPMVMHILEQAAEALQHAHDHQIIHQDVKPANFLIRSGLHKDRPDLLLADFGIAKMAATTSGTSQAIRGTPASMAPEQWQGQAVPATDQYALAIMIYQLLTGRAPFQGGPGQVMFQHMTAQPQPPSLFNPSLPPAIDAVILHALAKDLQGRFPSVAAFAQAFQQAVQGTDVQFAHADLSTVLSDRNRASRATYPIPRNDIITPPVESQSRTPAQPHTGNPAWLTPPYAYNEQVSVSTTRPAPNQYIPVSGLGQQFIEQRKRPRGGRIALLLVLLFLLVAGSVSAFYYSGGYSFGLGNSTNGSTNATSQTSNMTATTSAQEQVGALLSTQTATIQGSATAQANADATAQTNAVTATAQANVNATATAQVNEANATATAGTVAIVATATSQANASATATAIAAAPPQTPTQLSPANGSVFNNFPRATTLQWTAVAKAVSYTVEIDCYQCCAVNQWCTDVGKTWSLVSDIKQATYTFNFVGAQPGRWRVLAVNVSGQKSPVSGWWTFTYTV